MRSVKIGVDWLRLRRRAFGALLPAAAVVLPGCNASSDDDAGPVSLAEYPAAYAKAACAADRQCWGEVVTDLSSPDPCEDAYMAAVAELVSAIESAVAEGRVRYRPEKTRDCLDAVRRRGCTLWPDPQACVEMLDGTRPLGESCANNLDCAGSDTYCRTDASCPGQCARLKEVGEPCAETDECASSLLCDAGTGRCTPPAQLNQPCDTHRFCDWGLQCVFTMEGEPGRCVDAKDWASVGARKPCILDGEPYCAVNLRCRFGETAVCVQPGDAGSPCGPALPDMCPKDQYCAVDAAVSSDGVCTPRPQRDQPCADSFDPVRVCAAGLYCDGEMCRARETLGGSCREHWECGAGRCIDGICALAGSCTVTAEPSSL